MGKGTPKTQNKAKGMEGPGRRTTGLRPRDHSLPLHGGRRSLPPASEDLLSTPLPGGTQAQGPSALRTQRGSHLQATPQPPARLGPSPWPPSRTRCFSLGRQVQHLRRLGGHFRRAPQGGGPPVLAPHSHPGCAHQSACALPGHLPQAQVSRLRRLDRLCSPRGLV